MAAIFAPNPPLTAATSTACSTFFFFFFFFLGTAGMGSAWGS
jgi:hypothetical protein